MFTNRIWQYYDEMDGTTPDQSLNHETSSPAETDAPRGFMPVPKSLLPEHQGPQNIEEIYRAAYEQAIRDARQRLLDLLRSRMAG